MSIFDTLGLPGNSQNRTLGSSMFAPTNNTTLNPGGSGMQSQPVGGSSATSPLQTQYSLYNQGVQQQAGDYDSIMQGYKDLYNKAASLPQANISAGTYAPSLVNATKATYTENPDYKSAVSTLQGLANTGGYSTQDIADLRARGVSPIRSVYSSAQSNIDRAKALQGGYSPNYTAATAKMSRDESQQIADAVQNVNAGIAQNVASNKISAASPLASVTGAQNTVANNVGMANSAAENAASMANASAENQASQFNITSPQNAQIATATLNQNQLKAMQDALGGQASLYGTTPALASLFGNQALQGANLQAGINNQGNQLNANIFGQIVPRLG